MHSERDEKGKVLCEGEDIYLRKESWNEKDNSNKTISAFGVDNAFCPACGMWEAGSDEDAAK